MSWEDFWLGFLATILTVAAIFLSTWLLKDKHVDGYYLSSKFASSDKPDETCVEAHWTWHTDEHVFCTTDTEKALDFLNKANASVKK